LTLLGPGGVGKTRLALHLPRLSTESSDEFAFILLAPLNDAPCPHRHCPGAARPAARSWSTCSFDDFAAARYCWCSTIVEHVLVSASLVTTFLTACPELRVVTTNRARLAPSGEHVYLVPHLPLRTAGQPPADLDRVPASALLLQRSAWLEPSSHWTPRARIPRPNTDRPETVKCEEIGAFYCASADLGEALLKPRDASNQQTIELASPLLTRAPPGLCGWPSAANGQNWSAPAERRYGCVCAMKFIGAA
jgi:hypothetical protein